MADLLTPGELAQRQLGYRAGVKGGVDMTVEVLKMMAVNLDLKSLYALLGPEMVKTLHSAADEAIDNVIAIGAVPDHIPSNLGARCN